MEVVLLGTGYPFPDPNRAGPSTLVRAGGLNLLFDAGRGVLMRLSALMIGAANLDGVFLTHLHSDHTTDFNDIVTTAWALTLESKPLRVVGPPDTADYCAETLHMLRRDVAWRMEHHAHLTKQPEFEVTEIEQGLAFDHDGTRVVVAPTDHRPVKPTIGFRVEHAGASVVIGGDSVPCEGLDRLCEGADVYVQTVLRAPLIRPGLKEILSYHSSTEDAARTAARAGAKKLVFTHLMPAPKPGTEQDWVNDAKAHFDGEVIVAEDLQTVVT